MFLNSLDEFGDAVESLFTHNPFTTRYTLKFSPKRGKVVLKGTDNRVCYKFVLGHAHDLKRFEKVHNRLLRHMISMRRDVTGGAPSRERRRRQEEH